MKKIFWGAALILLSGFVSGAFSSCNKKSDTLKTDATVVKYELTGNYSGRIAVAFTTQNGERVQETVSLPWTREVMFRDNILLQFGGRTATPDYGIHGQAVMLKLYIAGQMRMSGNAIADDNGLITLPDIGTRIQ